MPWARSPRSRSSGAWRAPRGWDHKSSTLQDLEAGKPLELAAIVDSVVELADLTSVPAPSLRAVSAASGLLAESLGLR